MNIPNEPFFLESGVHGPMPVVWYGVSAPDGDATPFAQCPVGSQYIEHNLSSDYVKVWRKMAAASVDSDWVIGDGTGYHTITQRVLYSDFTDGGGAAGTLTMNETIPLGATVVGSCVRDLTGFTGDTSASLQIGDGTDADRYNAAADINLFTTAAYVTGGAAQGTAYHSAAKSITLTVTSGSDWGLVTAGAVTVSIQYYNGV